MRELLGAAGVFTSIENSEDLNTWNPAEVVLVSSFDQGDGTIIRRYRTAAPFDPAISPHMFLRLSVIRTE